MRRKLLIVLAALALSAVFSSAPDASIIEGRYSFEPGTWIHLSLELGDVMIEDVKFHRPPKWKGMLIRHDKPNRATVVVRNTGRERVDVGIAIAIFLPDGSLAGAGNSGATIGVLQPGERHEFTIPFHSVYREIDKADEFVITAEY